MEQMTPHLATSIFHEKTANEWPKSIIVLAGSWKDFPIIEEIRINEGVDARRETL